SRGLGKGLRAPGAWNPATKTLSEIWWQNADQLIAELPPCVSGNSLRIGEVRSFHSDSSPTQKDTSLSPLSLSAFTELIRNVETFRICQPATRRELLASMVGTAFHQVSRAVAEQIACAQFDEKTVRTNADKREHLS